MQSSSASTENSDAANSAQILVAVEAKSKAKVKPKAKKKQAVQGSAADKLANSQRDFLLKFQEKLDKALTLGRGCLSCGQDCLDRVKSFRSKLCDWRREFQGLTSDVQDRELLWVFGRSRPESQEAAEPVLRPKQPSESSSTSTEKSPREQEVMTTSTSGSDQDVLNLTCDTDVPKSPSKSGLAPSSGKRKYTARKTKSKTLSVNLKGVLCEENCFVCVGTAKFLLGIGSGRHSRVS